MKTQMSCPSCHARFQQPDRLDTDSLRCPRCGAHLVSAVAITANAAAIRRCGKSDTDQSATTTAISTKPVPPDQLFLRDDKRPIEKDSPGRLQTRLLTLCGLFSCISFAGYAFLTGVEKSIRDSCLFANFKYIQEYDYGPAILIFGQLCLVGACFFPLLLVILLVQLIARRELGLGRLTLLLLLLILASGVSAISAYHGGYRIRYHLHRPLDDLPLKTLFGTKRTPE